MQTPVLREFPLAPWLVALLLSAAACSDGPTVAEALAQSQEEQLPEGYEKPEIKLPKQLAPPTEAEFQAWNRKDPEGEKHLYKWDKAHLADMTGYWEELECFREQLKAAGQDAFGAEPGSPTEEQWFQFKRAFVSHVDGWQKRLFAEQPRILEKSKFVGNFLEAHELVMHGYIKAFNEADKTELEKADAHWTIIEAKNKRYVKNLGEQWPERDPEDAKAAAEHAKACDAAMKAPDRSGKAKRGRKKSPI